MHHLFPAVPIDKFDKQIFEAILDIYAKVARPLYFKVRDKEESIDDIVDLLKNMSHVEFVLGSSLHNRSKLYLFPLLNQNGLCVSFDIDPNTYDDQSKKPKRMRGAFRKKVSAYIETLGIE